MFLPLLSLSDILSFLHFKLAKAWIHIWTGVIASLPLAAIIHTAQCCLYVLSKTISIDTLNFIINCDTSRYKSFLKEDIWVEIVKIVLGCLSLVSFLFMQLFENCHFECNFSYFINTFQKVQSRTSTILFQKGSVQRYFPKVVELAQL